MASVTTNTVNNDLKVTSPKSAALDKKLNTDIFGIVPKKSTVSPQSTSQTTSGIFGIPKAPTVSPVVSGLLKSQPQTAQASATTPVKPATSQSVSLSPATAVTPQPTATSQTPLTGMVATPSGAIVNTAAGNVVQPPLVQTQTNGPSFSGLVSGLVTRASQDSPEVRVAREALQRSRFNEANALAENSLNPIPIGDQEGRARVLQDQYLRQQEALSNTLTSATQTQGQQIDAAKAAAGLATPTQVPYSAQYIDPLTGQPVGGGASSGGSSLSGAVDTIANRIKTGQMTYDQGVQALSGYGQGGVNALQTALGSGFNISQSNALASQQGTIGPAYNFAKAALGNLQTIASQLGQKGFLQGTNIPLINAIGNAISTGTGFQSDLTRQYQQAVAEARNAYAQLLASSRGGTPTEYGSQAIAAIPDNATPNDITAAINSLESLGGAKLSIYSNPGQVTTNTNANQSTQSGQPKGWF